ncbi:MAG: DUF5018 domain-containing protein [Muribaculaceae bacterium]|nr:DUF5018 domain-containing protein [Muribaculaceae bacterium]
MKKNILYLLALVMLVATSSCEDPKYVAPTADRQGLTSLTAIFTSGPFVDQEMARLEIGEEMPDRLVIPVPWFYPVTSDDETTPYMTNVRVQAALAPNCFIEPALTILDLTQENQFTYTDAEGNKKNIVITGERVKSNACELLSFAVLDPALSGIIDKANKKVSLISADDLSAVMASYEVSAHATISPDPSVEAVNINEPLTLTVTAHDGVTKAEYIVLKEVPEKIESGFVKESVEQLFYLDPVSNIGLPAYNQMVAPSLAALQGKVVICLGDGSTPIYVNGLTGVKMGEINLGSAVAGSVTNDEAENLLIVNNANGKEVINIYRTASVTEVPSLYYSYTNLSSCPVAKVKVNGNIDSDAIITITHGGVAGVTDSNEFTIIEVKNGTVVGAELKKADGCLWGPAPVNTATVVSASTNFADGYFLSYYPSYSQLTWFNADGSKYASVGSDLTGWGLNPNCLDSKRFNNVNYMALFVVSHFPHWGMGPELYLYNVNDKSKFTGSTVADVACLELVNDFASWPQSGDTGVASGDVVIAPSADGFKLYIYYYDHNSQVFGAYVADCIKD